MGLDDPAERSRLTRGTVRTPWAERQVILTDTEMLAGRLNTTRSRSGELPGRDHTALEAECR
jgi:hypothetical protein